MIELSVREDQGMLEEIFSRVQSNACTDFEGFFDEATLAFHEYPYYLRKAVNSFLRNGDPDGVLFIRDLPRDQNLPMTPNTLLPPVRKKTQASEFWLCSIASVLGEPVAYLQEKEGKIFHDIFPTQKNAAKLSSESSEIDLDFHTEIAFHPFLPDYILLYGLRQDPEKNALTAFSSIHHILPLLTSQQQATLFQPLFKTGIDYSFGSTSGARGNGPLLSVLYGHQRQPFLRYDLDLMVGITPEAQTTLEELKNIVYAVQKAVKIEPGSLLIIDNRMCVHSRSLFVASYDGRDRWLQRMLVMRDFSKARADTLLGRRVIATDFSQYLPSQVIPEVQHEHNQSS